MMLFSDALHGNAGIAQFGLLQTADDATEKREKRAETGFSETGTLPWEPKINLSKIENTPDLGHFLGVHLHQ